MARCERGHGDVFNFEWLVGGLEDCGFHGISLFGIRVEFSGCVLLNEI